MNTVDPIASAQAKIEAEKNEAVPTQTEQAEPTATEETSPEVISENPSENEEATETTEEEKNEENSAKKKKEKSSKNPTSSAKEPTATEEDKEETKRPELESVARIKEYFGLSDAELKDEKACKKKLFEPIGKESQLIKAYFENKRKMSESGKTKVFDPVRMPANLLAFIQKYGITPKDLSSEKRDEILAEKFGKNADDKDVKKTLVLLENYFEEL